VGQIELSAGVEHLRKLGLDVKVHPQTAKQHFIFAAIDQERAEAFYEYATDPSIDVIWSAGGGYGATRILSILEEMAEERGRPPSKLLVGYSDITALHELVRSRWNWASLHCPMPSAGNFCNLNEQHQAAAVAYVNRRKPADPWAGKPMQFMVNPPKEPIHGVLVGGNLSVLVVLMGTSYSPINVPGRILFLEDVDEAPYRIDRMATQLFSAGALQNLSAIVLGDFTDCKDSPSMVLAEPRVADQPAKRKPIRETIELNDALRHTFGDIGEKLGIPVAIGLPVGHGPNFAPLPLGAEYQLSPQGELHLHKWSWLRS
jgi:muramoyltetrapeptide carboxypeptidase